MVSGLDSRYTWLMDHDHDHPVAGMAARVAAVWRAQGEEFLDEHHAGMVADVDRLRHAVVTAPTLPLPHIDTERLLDRLRRLDAAAIERLTAGRADAVLDLTGPEPVVRPAASRASTDPAGGVCRRCRGRFTENRLVRPGGDRVRPLCVDCAYAVVGVRRRQRS
jgi:hypothetical protein